LQGRRQRLGHVVGLENHPGFNKCLVFGALWIAFRAQYLLGRRDPVRGVEVDDIALIPLPGPHNIQHLEPLPVKVPERPPLPGPLAPVLHRRERGDLLKFRVHHGARHAHLAIRVFVVRVCDAAPTHEM